MVTPAFNDQVAVAVGEVAATMATTIHHRHILPIIHTLSQHHVRLPVHPPGTLASSLARRLAQRLAMR